LPPSALVTLTKSGVTAGREIFLIEVEGFVATEDDRVTKFLEDNTDFSIARAVGSYAVPLTAET